MERKNLPTSFDKSSDVYEAIKFILAKDFFDIIIKKIFPEYYYQYQNTVNLSIEEKKSFFEENGNLERIFNYLENAENIEDILKEIEEKELSNQIPKNSESKFLRYLSHIKEAFKKSQKQNNTNSEKLNESTAVFDQQGNLLYADQQIQEYISQQISQALNSQKKEEQEGAEKKEHDISKDVDKCISRIVKEIAFSEFSIEEVSTEILESMLKITESEVWIIWTIKNSQLKVLDYAWIEKILGIQNQDLDNSYLQEMIQKEFSNYWLNADYWFFDNSYSQEESIQNQDIIKNFLSVPVLVSDKRNYYEKVWQIFIANKKWFYTKADLENIKRYAELYAVSIKAREVNEEVIRERNVLKALIDSIPDVLAIQNPDHTIDRYNKAWYEMLWITPEQAKWNKCYHLIGREDVCNNCQTEKAKQTKKAESTEKYVPELDKYFHVNAIPVLDPEGKVQKIIEQIQDISEYKIRENLIKKQNKFLSFISAVSSELIDVKINNFSEKIEFILSEIVEFFDLSTACLFNFSKDSKHVVKIADFSKWTQQCACARMGTWKSIPIEEVEQQVEKIQNWICLPIKKDKNTVGFLSLDWASQEDWWWTLEKTELLSVLANMFSDVLLKYDYENELIKAKEDAEKANIAKSLLISNMSHEVRTPLSWVFGLFDILLNSNLTEEEYDYHMDLLQESKDRLLHVINWILDLSKMEIKKMELKKQTFDVGNFVKSVFQQMMHSGKVSDQIQMQLDFDKELENVSLYWDNQKIAQCMINLINNALKFTDEWDVQVYAKKLSDTDNDVKISFGVKDTGHWIQEEELKKIFSPFEQADSSYTKKFEWSWLWLALTKSFVELMWGEIHAQSQVDKWSHFWFVITLEKSQQTPVDPQSDKESSSEQRSSEEKSFEYYNNFKILVAEDEKTNQIILKRILEKRWYQVFFTQDWDELLDEFDKEKYDLIITDIQMPNKNWVEATQQIRQNNKDIPIIALTAYSMEEEKKEFLDVGMNDVLRKPLNADQMFSTLDKFLHEE